MTIKSPPSPLPQPIIEVLSKGATIHRVFRSAYSSNQFNPCLTGQTRFAPISDSHGNCVPSLYAGSSFESAVFETIFHDIPSTTNFKIIGRNEIEMRSHSELITTKKLKLVSLRAPGLIIWGIKRGNLVGTSPKLYNQTAKWAEAIHHEYPSVQGLVWTSNQCDPDSAYLFFGDRVQPADFSVSINRNGLNDKSFLSDVRRTGRKSQIVIVI